MCAMPAVIPQLLAVDSTAGRDVRSDGGVGGFSCGVSMPAVMAMIASVLLRMREPAEMSVVMEESAALFAAMAVIAAVFAAMPLIFRVSSVLAAMSVVMTPVFMVIVVFVSIASARAKAVIAAAVAGIALRGGSFHTIKLSIDIDPSQSFPRRSMSFWLATFAPSDSATVITSGTRNGEYRW
jgi:hypothetical protein